jgi:L-alanine-DL-glutamate epimerase-like enolase superfamily enzyme
MKITDARVIVCSPGRNFVTLKLITEDGVYGLGDATLNGRELAVASYLTDHVVPMLIGRDARRIEDMWQLLYKGAYRRRGPVTMAAIAAVDTALWDILGKSAGMPVYRLLGGASREGVMVYAHANGEDPQQTVRAVAERMREGYKAVRAQSGIPGIEKTYGVSRGGAHYEPAEPGLPSEATWSTERYLDFVPSLFASLRKELGPETHLLHDAHHRLTPIEAARLGKELEPFHLFWLEDPVPAELQEGFRLVRRHTTTPLAVGEVFTTAVLRAGGRQPRIGGKNARRRADDHFPQGTHSPHRAGDPDRGHPLPREGHLHVRAHPPGGGREEPDHCRCPVRGRLRRRVTAAAGSRCAGGDLLPDCHDLPGRCTPFREPDADGLQGEMSSGRVDAAERSAGGSP